MFCREEAVRTRVGRSRLVHGDNSGSVWLDWKVKKRQKLQRLEKKVRTAA